MLHPFSPLLLFINGVICVSRKTLVCFKTISYFDILPGCSYGVFTNSDVLFKSWNALQLLHPADCTWSDSDINGFLFLLVSSITFSNPLLSFVNSFSDVMWVRVNGCAAMCIFKKIATTQYLDSRKEVCTSSGFVPLTRLEWDVPPRLLTPSAQQTLWNTPEHQVKKLFYHSFCFHFSSFPSPLPASLSCFFLLLLCTYRTDASSPSILIQLQLQYKNTVSVYIYICGGGGQMGCVQMLRIIKHRWRTDKQKVDWLPGSSFSPCRWLPVSAPLTLTLIVLSWALTSHH